VSAWGIAAVVWGAAVGMLLFMVSAVAAAFDGPEPTMRVFWLYAALFVVGVAGVVMQWRGQPQARAVLVAAGALTVVGVAVLAIASDWPRGAPLSLGGVGFLVAGLVGGRRGRDR
jgi:CHASE2 domain-containing sensor protein